MNVTLPPDLERVVSDELQSGRFHGAGEFLTAAVQHYLIARDLGEAYSRGEIEDKIERGLAQIERGEVIDGEEAFRRLRAWSAERRQQAPR